MNPVVVTPPADYPVTLAEAKDQARAKDYADDDDFLLSAIKRGTDWAEARMGRALITRTYRGFLDSWPWNACSRSAQRFPPGFSVADWRSIELPMPLLQSVAHVITYDDSDTPTTIDPAQYYVDTASFVGRVVRRAGVAWAAPARIANGIEIQWIAGYGDTPDTVPDDIRHAILLMIDHFYENRSAAAGRDGSIPLPLGADDFVLPHRVYSLG